MAFKKKYELMVAIVICLLISACIPAERTEPNVPPISVTDSDSASDPTSQTPPTDPVSQIKSEVEAARFLARATFGGTKSEISALNGGDAADWIAREFSKPVSLTLPNVSALTRDEAGRLPADIVDSQYWDHIIGSEDQLRQRMAFALSQIVVYSDAARRDQALRAYYQDILIRNAFGNYRDLLEEVTYSPAMGEWLTYRGNRKGDPITGRMPDENYAREILQLFSIGLVELNMDGSPKLDGQGQQIETYSNDDIQGLARVFTGLSWAGDTFNEPPEAGDIRQMVMFPEHHSELEKTFLGTTIPAGTAGDESIQIALDTIFEHPNTAPFISRLLIQRFTQSDPSPGYIQRVAMAFELGSFQAEGGQSFGTGKRGDLRATLAAILLDPATFASPEQSVGDETGKVREPILRFTHWARAFNVSGLDAHNETKLWDTSGTTNSLGQQAFSSPSVFNFYRPGYVAPGTSTGERDITVPEFQIVNESSSVGYLNFMTVFAFDRAAQNDNSIETYKPDYSDELALVDDPVALIDHLDNLLTGGRMSDDEKTDILDIITTLEVRTNSPSNTAADEKIIVQAAVALFLNSPSFAVIF